MIINALIIDDEPLAHKVILEYVKDIPYIEIVGQCHSAIEALGLLNSLPIDLIFLDINMPRLSGLDFLRTLSSKPMVVITSAYQEFALESYELDVCDYLLKPFRFERFMKATNKVLSQIQLQKGESKIVPSSEKLDNNPIFIKSDKKLVQVELMDIYFLENYGNYIKIWLKDKYYLTPGSLSNFEKKLPNSIFFKIHKSFIINRTFIDYIEGNMVKTKNDKTLPIGKMHRQNFKAFLSS